MYTNIEQSICSWFLLKIRYPFRLLIIVLINLISLLALPTKRTLSHVPQNVFFGTWV